MTPARKAAFEKARKVRHDNRAKNKKLREKTEEELNKLKEYLKNKRQTKVNKSKINELKDLDTSSEEEAPKKKSLLKKQQKTVHYSSLSSSSSSQ